MITYEQIDIVENSYQKLIRLISEETKLNFEYYRRNFIERRIKSRMIRVGCYNLESYYDYIIRNPEELTIFLDKFSINYTYFFRNWEVFNQFQNLFLDCFNIQKNNIQCDLRPNPNKIKNTKLKKSLESSNLSIRNSKVAYIKDTSLYEKITAQKGRAPIYIWSCPCATGEEPYSIAMIFDNLKNQIPNFPSYKIVASDIDSNAIECAKSAKYIEDSTKEMSTYFENRYFNKIKEIFGYKYSMSEDIKNSVDFITEDVTEGHKNNFKYDVVFCRYLMIYFNRNNRESFIKTLDHHIKVGGLLILGKTETLLNSSCNFMLVDAKNHIYMKT